MANQPVQQRLAELRARMARIDRKYANARPTTPAPMPPRFSPEQYFPEEWLHGEVVETEHGCHFETERLWRRNQRHGSISIHELEDLPDDLLQAISQGEIERAGPRKWAFLDTETTGLAGGAGSYAFLIGIGRIAPDGFRVRQFFMRHYGEEASLLHAVAEHLSQFDVLITYNGKIYDEPLLAARYIVEGRTPPFERLAHFDLLFGARRLWKLQFDSCRLMDLEKRIMGVEREGDLPGELIPYVYFEYLRTREAFRLLPIFHHNAIDILSLACLTAIVPWAFHSPERVRLSRGGEMVGLARWLREARQYDKALDFFRRAIDRGLPDDLLFRTLWDTAALEKKLGDAAAALNRLTELAGSRNPFRAAAMTELAKHYERRERDYAKALELTRSALELEDTDALRRREARLQRRIASAADGV